MSAKRLPAKNKPISVIAFFAIIALIPISELVHQIVIGEYLQAIVIFLWFLAIFLLPVFLFKKNLKIYLLILSPIYLLIPLNLLYILTFNSAVSSDLTLLFLNTNRYEVMELLKHYYMPLILIGAIYLAILIFLYSRSPKVIASKLAFSISGISLVVVLLFPFLDIKHNSMTYYNTARTSFNNIFPTSILKGVNRYVHENRLIKSSKPYRDVFKFDAKQDSSVHNKQQVVILIIGESSRYDHWGINGYARNTSPRLSKRTNLISFNNVATGAYVTERSVPLILTGVGAVNFDEHVKRKGVFGVFDEAGFNTYFITDQPGDTGNIGVHALESQHQYHMMQDKHHDKDMNLLDTLNKIIRQPGDKKFIIIHTMGSHYDYADRYSPDYEVFKPSNTTVKSRVNDLAKRNVLVNTYDNTIAYSDAVIDSVISVANRLNVISAVTYISDHGEDLLDNSKHYNYHINGLPPSTYVAHIPMFLWYSPKLQQQYPDKISNLMLHKNSKISSENVIYTLSSLLGINYPKLDPSKDVTSGNYKDNQQVLMGEGATIYPFSVCK